MKNLRNNATFIKYNNYLNAIRGDLIASESTICAIKNSREYINCIHYFNRLQMEGKIKQQPTYENGYTVTIGETDIAFYQRHLDYLNAIRETMLHHQDRRNAIKGTKDFKDCKRYFMCLKYRGQIEENPNSANGYTVTIIGG